MHKNSSSTLDNLPPVITLDGPSGTGKGTVSQMLAQKLNWHYLDSGSMFRILAYAAFQKHITLEDENTLAHLAETLDATFHSCSDNNLRILLSGEDITYAIRTEQISQIASQIAVYAKVRTTLANQQRTFRKSPGLVTDGRDMGTIIFPDATIKFFLDASAEERARRRYLQLKKQGINVSLADVLKDIQQRDERDQSRTLAPLKPANDAIIIDTTLLSVEQVFDEVYMHTQQNKRLSTY